MARLDLGEERHRGVAMVFAIVFALSFVIGTFFPYQGMGDSLSFFFSRRSGFLAFSRFVRSMPGLNATEGTGARSLCGQCSD